MKQVESYISFKDASVRAKQIAAGLGSSVSIQRAGEAWEVVFYSEGGTETISQTPQKAGLRGGWYQRDKPYPAFDDVEPPPRPRHSEPCYLCRKQGSPPDERGHGCAKCNWTGWLRILNQADPEDEDVPF